MEPKSTSPNNCVGNGFFSGWTVFPHVQPNGQQQFERMRTSDFPPTSGLGLPSSALGHLPGTGISGTSGLPATAGLGSSSPALGHLPGTGTGISGTSGLHATAGLGFSSSALGHSPVNGISGTSGLPVTTNIGPSSPVFEIFKVTKSDVVGINKLISEMKKSDDPMYGIAVRVCTRIMSMAFEIPNPDEKEKEKEKVVEEEKATDEEKVDDIKLTNPTITISAIDKTDGKQKSYKIAIKDEAFMKLFDGTNMVEIVETNEDKTIEDEPIVKPLKKRRRRQI
jgi:hypothetical protein